jgi:hypothetical protein
MSDLRRCSPAIRQQRGRRDHRADRELDYAWFVDDEAAYRVRAEVPALRQLAYRVVLIVGDAGAFKLRGGSRVARKWLC